MHPRSGLVGPRLIAIGPPTTGDEVLDRAVHSLRLRGPRHPDSLLRKHAVGLVGGVVAAVAARLADIGLLTFGDDGRRRRLTSSWVRPDSSEHAALMARVAHGVGEQSADLRTAILITLLDAGKQLRHVLPQHDRSLLRARSRELQATLGAAAPIVEAVRRSGRLRLWQVAGLIVDGLGPG